ncbi:MAG: sugar phosphate isomerase/epimerase family protein [Flavisolibacter sp.]
MMNNKPINRKSFIQKTALGFCATWTLSQLPAGLLAQSKAMNIKLGFQTFPIRDKIATDFAGTLKMMAAMGYQLIEMCSPKGYAEIGFGPLVNMKTSDMRSIITHAGLTCPSCHFGFGELTDHLDESIEFAKELGLSQMICSTFWLPKTATLNDYLLAADKLNKAAEKIKTSGMQAGFHNHSFEFAQLEGELIYDALMKRFDPELVKMQFQTEVINLGYKASTYFNKYPGRFISAHLSDWTSEKKQVPVGKGIIDWKDFFTSAKTGGVKNFFVEMDMEMFKPSAEYIHKGKFEV